MGDVVNLNQFRKRREQIEARRRAAQNRARFGRAKQERETTLHELDRRRGEHDRKLLDSKSKPDDKTPDAG